jgi:hypothetical protein
MAIAIEQGSAQRPFACILARVTQDGSDREKPREHSRRAWWLLAGLLLLLTLPRVWQLELDPPNTIVRGYSDQAHYRDEAAKAHEARNQAKWDRWSLSELDEYGFWRAQSPSWVWGETLWFRAFGVGLVEARVFVVVHSIVALALLMWLAMVRHGLPTAVAAGLLLGLNWAYLVFSRLALMEGALLCWLLLASAALSQFERRPAQAGRWALLATLAMLVACTIKQTGLLLVPAFSVTLLLLGLRAAGIVVEPRDDAAPWRERLRARLHRREAKLTMLALAVLGLVLSMLVFNPEYQERLAFNAAHFTAAREQSVLARAARTLARGLFSFRLQLMFTMFAPRMLWLATVDLARVTWLGLRGVRARRRGEGEPARRGLLEGRPSAIDWWMLAWAVFALLANLASPHRAVRFQLVMLPPAAWLAAALIGRAWLHAWPSAAWTRAVRAGLVTLALLGGFLTTLRFVDWMRYSDPSAARIGEGLTALIGEREAVVVGEFAAQAVFETDYQHFYVRPNQFNDSAEVITGLGITHLAVAGEEDFVETHMQNKVPELLVGRRKLGSVWFRRRELVVWELASAERRAEIEIWRAAQAELAKAERQVEERKQQQVQSRRNRLERRAAQCLPEPLPDEEPTRMTVQPVDRLAPEPARGRPGNRALMPPR